MIDITFPDGKVKNFPEGTTPKQIAESIHEKFAQKVLSAKINNNLVEFEEPINSSGDIQFFTWDDDYGKQSFWHSSAHILAQAVLHYFPKAKLTIGPPIENGFYYDFDFGDLEFGEKDFEKIEKKVLEIAEQSHSFYKYPVSKKDALKEYQNNSFKKELVENLTDGEITFCKHSDFTDLCRGGHISNTGHIKAVKLLNVAGAYWRGNEKNPQLTRVYAISFPTKKLLDKYILNIEEALKRDHRKLGKELQLFTFSDKVGQGLPLWLPKGAILRKKLENYLHQIQINHGYEMVITPHIGNKSLYETSGHYEKYGKDSFQPIKTPDLKEEYLLKPMNCPHHCEIYKSFQLSYRDLPKRFAEFGTVYRYEQSGELHGLTRVRSFTQDDAHIFCTTEQLHSEFKDVINIILKIFKALKFEDFLAQISLRDKNNPSKYLGNEEDWEKAEQAIIDATKDMELPTKIEYGEAAFYGPKLDFMVKDALGRKWQLGTIQVDYNLPQRFELEYKGSDNQDYRPVMIHRAPFGSLERFIAVLIEHTAGNFPLWLSPNPVSILPIGESQKEYALKIQNLFKINNVVTHLDDRNEKLSKKIRDAEVGKSVLMLILGDKELSNNTITIRKKGESKQITIEYSKLWEYFESEVEKSKN